MFSAIQAISRLGLRSSASDRPATDESGFNKVAALLWRALTCCTPPLTILSPELYLPVYH